MTVSDGPGPELEYDVVVHALALGMELVLDPEEVGAYHDAHAAARAGQLARCLLRREPLPAGVRPSEAFALEVALVAGIIRDRGGDPARALVTVRAAGQPVESESEVRSDDE
jgi:hypothetical protein